MNERKNKMKTNNHKIIELDFFFDYVAAKAEFVMTHNLGWRITNLNHLRWNNLIHMNHYMYRFAMHGYRMFDPPVAGAITNQRKRDARMNLKGKSVVN